jgi:outer membrane protein TolC
MTSLAQISTQKSRERRLGIAGAFGAMLIAAVLGSSPGAAQDAAKMEVSTQQQESMPAAELRQQDDALHLTLEEAIGIALQRNLSVVIGRHNLAASEDSILANKGIYDLGSQLQLTTADSKSPTASQLVGATVEQQQQKNWNLGVSQLTPIGGTAGLSWDNAKFQTNSLDSTFNPYYSSSLAFFYSQPLLRNLGRKVTERNLTIARTNREISMHDFELQVTTVVQQVIDAYWNLVEAQEQLTVAQESLKLAQELHEQNKIRVRVGTLAPLELVQSEAGVATRKEEIIRARSAVGDAADQLRLLLNLEQGPAWSASIVPETDPETAAVTVDLRQAIQDALKERPELLSQALQVENRRVDKIFAKNQTKPRLDLDLSYNLSGLGGTALKRDPITNEVITTFPGGYSDALDQITGRDFDSWRLNLTLAMPIQNRTAKGNAAAADEQLASATTQLTQLKQQVVTEVRTAARGVQTAEQQITSAKVSRRLAEKNLDAERKKYDNGMSTSYQVLQIQNDLAQARSREVSAVVGFRRALAEYYRATGKLLPMNGIDVVATDSSSG